MSGPAGDWPEVARHFTTRAVAHLATVGKDGGPRSVPLWIDREGETDLVFFTEEDAVKDRNLRRDPRVALSITAPDNAFSMATVRGEVHRRLEGAEAMAVVDRISRVYTGEDYELRSGLVAFVVRPSSWRATDYSEDG